MRKNSGLLLVIQTALMAAIIFVVTYLVRIPMPIASGGYLNIGDTPLYIAAYLLGGPAGAVAGAIGSAMSDLSAGYVIYALPTAIIKGTMGFVCGTIMARTRQKGEVHLPMQEQSGNNGGADAEQKGTDHVYGQEHGRDNGGADAKPADSIAAKRGGLKRFILASILGGAIMVGGYAIFETLFFNLNQALVTIPLNCVQWAGGVAAATALYPAARAVDRALK
ncbi:MAG: ECF transporter S component [Clostridiales Family XIII bacterium]|jgi:uncharacterized membrane protein|nr:ECF transporter S component [Clostridiales Family XIII bacterium]